MDKTQEPIKLAGTYGKYAGIETMREAKQALHAKDAEIADKQDKLNKLTDHVRHHVKDADAARKRIEEEQDRVRALIRHDNTGTDHNGHGNGYAMRYHENAWRLHRETQRIVTLAPVLELLTGENPADIIETK